MLGVRAVRIDTTERFVELEDRRRLPYDTLLIATGGRNRRLSIPGADLAGIYGLAYGARRRPCPGGDGLGPACRGRRNGIHRLRGRGVAAKEGPGRHRDRSGRTPLFRVFGEDVGRSIAELHRAHGVRTIFEDTVAAFEGDGHVASVLTRDGLRLECDFVVAGVGIEPAVEITGGSAIGVDNGIIVDEFLETNINGIFGAGDVANHYHPLFGRYIRLEHWQNAVRQGAAAAHNMLGQRNSYREIPWFWSDQYDLNLQYIGFHTTWDQLVVRGRLDAGNYLACYINNGRVDAGSRAQPGERHPAFVAAHQIPRQRGSQTVAG